MYWADTPLACKVTAQVTAPALAMRANARRLPAAKAAKADSSQDMKGWLEATVADLLALVDMPEWPGAMLMLRRLVLILHG